MTPRRKVDAAARLNQAPPPPDVQQDRARRTYHAVLEAAADLFERHGYDHVGTPEIAEHAGVSVGTLYRYFADKHVLYVEIVRRMLADAHREVLARLTIEQFAGRGPHATIALAVELFFEHVLRRPHLSRSLFEMSLRDPDVRALRRAFDDTLVARLTDLLTALTPRERIPDPEATAMIAFSACMQCASSLAGHAGEPAVSAARAKAALTVFLERALFGETLSAVRASTIEK